MEALLRRVELVSVCALAVLFTGCAANVKTYVKEGQDFSAYKEIAIASFASDPKLPDTAKGAAELPAFLYAIMSANGYSVIDPAQSVAELKKLAPPEKELSPDTSAALGKALKVNAVLQGVVKYYGAYEEAVEPQLSTTSEREGAYASSSQRRLGFHSREESRVRPRFTGQAGGVEKEYKVTVRIELFDVSSKTVVWWGETTAGGESDRMKTYANAVFDALLKRFPAPHVRR